MYNSQHIPLLEVSGGRHLCSMQPFKDAGSCHLAAPPISRSTKPVCSASRWRKGKLRGTSALNHLGPEVTPITLLTFYWQSLVTWPCLEEDGPRNVVFLCAQEGESMDLRAPETLHHSSLFWCLGNPSCKIIHKLGCFLPNVCKLLHLWGKRFTFCSVDFSEFGIDLTSIVLVFSF